MSTKTQSAPVQVVEVGEPVGLWYRVRSTRARSEHADLSRICASGAPEYVPVAPLYGPSVAQRPVPLHG